ncbi:hypothetical protein NKR23_g790 [Pleurostoma richardsiae]|uniref:Uncharacterized protein n=1 Tax=Pleurostoma richardsiae TaxID=41990 RepID=A0AA38S7M6_9PEZI|nr:hypothetical protein NKR23_g790 [Pleurostoma richardsiae]
MPLLDFVSPVVSAAKYAWDVYTRCRELPKDAKRLSRSVRSLYKQLESSQSIAKRLWESGLLDPELEAQLEDACRDCVETLEEADKTAQKLQNETIERLRQALFASDEVVGLFEKLRCHREELQGVNGNITTAICHEIGLQQKRYPPIPDDQIPDFTPDFVRQLLRNGDYVDKRDHDGHTALYIAAECDVPGAPLTKLLLRQGADPTKVTRNLRMNAVHVAAYHNQPDVLIAIKNHLTAAAALPEDQHDRAWQQELRKQSQRVKQQRAQGAGNSKWRALLQSTSMDGRTPLHLAAEGMPAEIADGELHQAAEFLLAELAAQLSSTATSVVNARDESGKTPLHVTAERGKVCTLGALLAAGAKVHVRDKSKKTPLYLAVEGGHLEVVESLLANLATKPDAHRRRAVNACDESCRTPLHIAAETGNVLILNALVTAEATIDIQDKDGKTPLHVAAEKGKIHALKKLLAAGATTNMQDRNGRTPLHIAAKKGYIHTLKALLEAGATVDALDKSGHSPLALAEKGGHQACMDKLRVAIKEEEEEKKKKRRVQRGKARKRS